MKFKPRISPERQRHLKRRPRWWDAPRGSAPRLAGELAQAREHLAKVRADDHADIRDVWSAIRDYEKKLAAWIDAGQPNQFGHKRKR